MRMEVSQVGSCKGLHVTRLCHYCDHGISSRGSLLGQRVTCDRLRSQELYKHFNCSCQPYTASLVHTVVAINRILISVPNTYLPYGNYRTPERQVSLSQHQFRMNSGNQSSYSEYGSMGCFLKVDLLHTPFSAHRTICRLTFHPTY